MMECCCVLDGYQVPNLMRVLRLLHMASQRHACEILSCFKGTNLALSHHLGCINSLLQGM